jgi:transcriptional regulator with XRE-family HTH domain
MDLHELGSTIKEARIREGYTQKFLAEKLNMDITTIVRWESGERRPKQKSLQGLSRLLNIKIQTLQTLAGYTPEFDWYCSLTAPRGSVNDILTSASEDEKVFLRQYLHYLRFSEKVTSDNK